jgi:hypothetical protein
VSSIISLLFFFATPVFVVEKSYPIELFGTTIKLPNSCIWQLTDTVENDEIAVFKCDKGFDHEVSVLIQEFDYNKIMEVWNAIDVTVNSENKIGRVTHFHIEATIANSRGDSENYIDAFCDPKYCIVSLGENPLIANSIAKQLKKVKEDTHF